MSYTIFSEIASNLLEKQVDLSNYEIDGSGNICINNTGGSSAAEGGMGTGGGEETGAGINENDKTKGTKEEADGTWDPLKPKEEKEKE